MSKALLKTMILEEHINEIYDGALFLKLAQGPSMS